MEVECTNGKILPIKMSLLLATGFAIKTGHRIDAHLIDVENRLLGD